ncbi:MAG TPA: hypothetical protein VKF17_15480 [Isosphaeraceae bacterium]|nr:hypothetical protein [Isosphaeraceae bacterium]
MRHGRGSTLGSLYAAKRGYEIVPERGGQFQNPNPRRKPEAMRATDGDLDQQAARDFLDNVKSRKLRYEYRKPWTVA